MGEQGFIAAAWSIFTKIFLPWLPGTIGSLIALRFLGASMTNLQRVACFLIGLVCMHYAGNAIIEASNIVIPAFCDAIKFACGLFGFAVVRETFKEIEQANILQTIRDKLVDRFLGKKP
jgi:hypothetical protein